MLIELIMWYVFSVRPYCQSGILHFDSVAVGDPPVYHPFIGLLRLADMCSETVRRHYFHYMGR